MTACPFSCVCRNCSWYCTRLRILGCPLNIIPILGVVVPCPGCEELLKVSFLDNGVKPFEFLIIPCRVDAEMAVILAPDIWHGRRKPRPECFSPAKSKDCKQKIIRCADLCMPRSWPGSRSFLYTIGFRVSGFSRPSQNY